MTPKQQVVLFCKQHQLKVHPVGADKVVMISKQHLAGAMWIECFDSWKDCYSLLCRIQVHYLSVGVKPWDVANVK